MIETFNTFDILWYAPENSEKLVFLTPAEKELLKLYNKKDNKPSFLK